MKTLLAGLMLLSAIPAFLVPSAVEGAQTTDPRDSIILESKCVHPRAGACASAVMRVRVWITNKDSLANISLPFSHASLSGGAYATLSRPASCAARSLLQHSFDFLYPPEPGGTPRLTSRIGSYSGYNSVSRDSTLYSFTLSNPSDDNEKFPTNPTRALLGEIKFDTVKSNLGQMVIDSSKILAITIQFVDLGGNAVFINFAKSIITVTNKGDLNQDDQLTSPDMVLMLNCAFCSSCPDPPPGRAACDFDCSGLVTPTDVVRLLNAIFLGFPSPCCNL